MNVVVLLHFEVLLLYRSSASLSKRRYYRGHMIQSSAKNFAVQVRYSGTEVNEMYRSLLGYETIPEKPSNPLGYECCQKTTAQFFCTTTHVRRPQWSLLGQDTISEHQTTNIAGYITTPDDHSKKLLCYATILEHHTNNIGDYVTTPADRSMNLLGYDTRPEHQTTNVAGYVPYQKNIV